MALTYDDLNSQRWREFTYFIDGKADGFTSFSVGSTVPWRLNAIRLKFSSVFTSVEDLTCYVSSCNGSLYNFNILSKALLSVETYIIAWTSDILKFSMSDEIVFNASMVSAVNGWEWKYQAGQQTDNIMPLENINGEWNSGGTASPLTTKGDIYAYGTENARLPIGADGLVLIADSAQALGLRWGAIAGTGDVVGPAGATDNALARYNLATGKAIQNSVAILNDLGDLSGIRDITLSGTVDSVDVLALAVIVTNNVDQDVKNGAAPTLVGTNFSGIPNSALTTGIADTNIVVIDHAGVVDNDYAKFTANGLEGRSYAETLSDLSGQAAGAFSFNSQNLTSVGTIGCGTITIANGSSLNLQEDTTFTGATTENLIKMPDNLADALSIQEDTNKYLTFVTTNSAEQINVLKPLFINETEIRLDEALSADGTYSGITCAGVLGDTIAVGDLVYLQTSDQRWELTDADAEATAGDVMLGICLSGGNDADATTILLKGFVRVDAWNFTSYGQALFVDTTAGDMSHTAPSGTGDIVRVVGYAHDNADTIYFDPSKSWVEVA